MRSRTAGSTKPAAALLVPLLVVLCAAGLAGQRTAAAAGGGSVSVSDATPEPGQIVTVTASGLLPGGEVTVDYLPDGVRLATLTADPDGGLRRDVQIPLTTHDGPKEIRVTALDAAGGFTSLPAALTIKGPPATATLSDLSLRPNQVVRLSGTRWFAGTTVLVVLFPGAIELGPVTAGSDGRFDVSLRMPGNLRNGPHGIQVFGQSAGGKVANLKLFPTVSGGTGAVGSLDIPDDPGLVPPSSSTSTTTTTLRSTTTLRRSAPLVGDTGSDIGVVVLTVVTGLALLAIAVGWALSPQGRRWDRSRRRRRRRRRGR